MNQRWKLTIEYDGTNYSGWQRQEEGIVSIQGAVEDAIFGFCQQRLTIHVAGRTDAGVHARAQVAHFDLDYGDRVINAPELINAINAHLRDQPIVIVTAEPVDQDFHARFSAKNKLYLYRIINRAAPAAVEKGLIWHVRRPLNVDSMREAAKHLVGLHDFSTFRAGDCQALSPVKTLDRLDIDVVPYDESGGTEIRIMAEGRSFLHHQVRNMVGTLELVGQGKWQADDVKTALEAKDRSKGGPTCPSDGLYLMRVDY